VAQTALLFSKVDLLFKTNGGPLTCFPLTLTVTSTRSFRVLRSFQQLLDRHRLVVRMQACFIAL
jgi:hypothetical protein